MHHPPLEPNPFAAQALRFAAEHGIAARRHRDFVALEFADGLDEEKFVFQADGFTSIDASGSTSEELSQALEGFLSLAEARMRVLRGLERRIIETGGAIEKYSTGWRVSNRAGCHGYPELGYCLTDRIRKDGAAKALIDLLAAPWIDGKAGAKRIRELLDDTFRPQKPPAPPDLEANPGAPLASAIKAAYLPGIESLELPEEARQALAKIDEIADTFAQELREAVLDPGTDENAAASETLEAELERRFDVFQSTIPLPGASDLQTPTPQELDRADRWAAGHVGRLRARPYLELRRNPASYIEGYDWYLSEEDWLRHSRHLLTLHPDAWGSAEGAFLLEKEPKPERYASARRWATSFLEEGAYDADCFADTLTLLRPDMPELDAIVSTFSAPRQRINAWRVGVRRLEKAIRDRVLRADDLLHELDSLTTASAVDLARLFTPAELAGLRERCQRWAKESDELTLKLHHRSVTEIALRMEWLEIFEILRDHPRFDHILWTIGAPSRVVLGHVRKTLREFLAHLEVQGFRDIDFARGMIGRLEQAAESGWGSIFLEEDLLHWTAIPEPPPQVATIVCQAILEADAGKSPSSLLQNCDYLAIAWSRLRRAQTKALVQAA